MVIRIHKYPKFYQELIIGILIMKKFLIIDLINLSFTLKSTKVSAYIHNNKGNAV